MSEAQRIFFEKLEEDLPDSYSENHSLEEIYTWLEKRKQQVQVSLRQITLDECDPWYYDPSEGCIRNKGNSFFRIYGLSGSENGSEIISQPVIEQDEIGFLGIISCKINGTWHYLMQAKIEPGNVNVVQLSPTLQATRSNFTARHGGKKPAYLDFFLHMEPEDILVDQIQSEQSSRFLRKRNRNVILRLREPIEEKESHRWMTLKQIKELLKQDNLVNMDTRTVLSCIPYVLLGQEGDVPFKNKPYFYKTAWRMNRKTLVELYKQINDYKMFSERHIEKVPLFSLPDWRMEQGEFVCERPYPFKVIFCDIRIGDREVTNWRQPLFAATGKALFGLFVCDDDGIMKFLVKIRPEAGCFDKAEIGPTVQRECVTDREPDEVEKYFLEKVETGEDIIADRILSEEGGRFYQEENRNLLIYVRQNELKTMPPGYVWSDYGTLNMLTQVNNCLNIQLRNLLSLLEV